MEPKMLKYVQAKLNDRDMALDSLLIKTGIGKSTFYRYTSQPYRFKKSQLDNIAIALNLSTIEREELYSFVGIKPGSTDISVYVDDLLFTHSAVNDRNDLDFSYYEPLDDEEEPIIKRLDAKTVAATFIRKFFSEQFESSDYEEFRHQITCNLYRSLDKNNLICLANLIFQMYEFPKRYLRTVDSHSSQLLQKNISEKAINHISHVTIKHYLDEEFPIKASEKIEFFSIILPLFSLFDDYSYNYNELKLPVWTGEDMCVIKYSITPFSTENNELLESKKKHRFLLIKLSDHSTKYLLDLGNNRNAYNFFSMDHRAARINNTSNIDSAIKLNDAILNLMKQDKMIIVLDTICLDTTKYSAEQLNEIIKDKISNDEIFCKELKNFLDPYGVIPQGVPFDSILHDAIEVLRQRFNARNEQEAINIISSTSLSEFAKKRYTKDFYALDSNGEPFGKSVRFEKSDVSEQLAYIFNHLGNTSDEDKNDDALSIKKEQTFYLLKPNYDISKGFIIVNNVGVWCTDINNQNRISHSATFNDSDVASQIYTCLLDKVNNNSGKFDSPIMSKSKAQEYIISLFKDKEFNLSLSKNIVEQDIINAINQRG